MPPQIKLTAGDSSWFTHDRFGLFIHWGLYAMPARGEWIKTLEKQNEEAYDRYFALFDPDQFDPKSWAKAAREAGMKYMVITTKHHEGFCLWDTAFTDYKITNTPFGRDALHEIVDAFRAEGLRIGFYYSIIDWHHLDFTLDYLHPRRDDDAESFNAARDMKVYTSYMRDQVRELLTQFGQIDILWFDFSYPDGDPKTHPHLPGKGHNDWESEKLLELVRELAPHAMVNNRLDLQGVAADMHTPEQFQPPKWVEVEGERVVWEACQTFSGSWGYHRDESNWKSPSQLIEMLIDTVSKGGNLLMNVGPTARGRFDQRALDALRIYHDWMDVHERAIYGCTQSEFQAPTDVRFTQNHQTNRLYVHLFAYPFKFLALPGLKGRVAYAQFLNDGSEVPLKARDWTADHAQKQFGDDVFFLELPTVAPPYVVPVIEIYLQPRVDD